jgi:dTDP-D-glucose 4,6-dehydratase
MRVFITGGAGFIGSHLADHYVAAGNQVTILDNFSTGSKTNIAHLDGKVTTVDGDIRNIELVESLTKDADLVLHMAAALGVNTILESPLESMSTNITGSEVVLKQLPSSTSESSSQAHLKFMARTQSNHYLKLMIALLVPHKRSAGHTAMQKQLKKLWLLHCTKKRNCL